jgi:PQQ-dependent dehydrogenase (methanol/ethanol family)
MNLHRPLRALALAAATTMVAFAFAQSNDDMVNPPAGEWPQLGRDATQTRYSPLDQINTDNVTDLQLTWARDMGYRQTFQGGPSVWDGVMYVATQTGVMALDATNGATIWEFSSPNEGTTITDSAVRGSPVIYDGKVFINTRYGATVALNAATGEELWRTQITNEALQEGFTTNPIWANGKIAASVTGTDSGGNPGRIVSIDAEDGEILWTFNIIPTGPEDPAWATWTNAPSWDAGIGGASAWNAGGYDPVSNIVLWGTGQPTPWDRVDPRRADPDGVVTDDLYTVSWVAVDADTGELKWYRQALPGDEWDYDQHHVPTFATVDWEGTERRIAILGSSTGYIYIIDTVTGEYLADHPGFTTAVEGAEFTIITGYDENGRGIVSDEAREANQAFEETFEYFRMCPGLRWAHIAPPAYSPDTGLFYRPNQANCMDYGAQTMPDNWQPGERAYFFESGPNRPELWFDRLGALTAFDPITGEVAWEFAYDYGYDAGPVVTAGNLVFSAFTDRMVRAFNATTGEELWSQALTTGSRAGTITYMVDGKQYVATMVGMTGFSGAPVIADYNPNVEGLFIPPTGGVMIFVFALP